MASVLEARDRKAIPAEWPEHGKRNWIQADADVLEDASKRAINS